MPDDNNTPDKITLRTALTIVTGNAAMLAAFLYLLGWVYLYSYFNSFGITVGQVGVNWTDAITHSVTVLRAAAPVKLLFQLLTLSILATLISLFWRADAKATALLRLGAHYLHRVIHQAPRWCQTTITALLAACVLASMVDYARNIGIMRAGELRVAGGDGATIALKKDCASALNGYETYNENQQLKRIFTSEKWQVFLIQDGTWSNDRKKIDLVTILQVPAECVIWIRGHARPAR